MPDVSEDVEKMEQEIPGFKRQYKSNILRIFTKRFNQGVKPNPEHLHQESVDTTKRDIDRMTELLKVEPLMERLEEADEEIAQTGEDAVMAFIDVNLMRKFNEKWQHRGGDFALKTIGQTLKKALRITDIAGRYGGDEIVVLLRNIKLEKAEEIFKDRFFPILIQGVTVSVGISQYKAGRLERTLKSADTAMMDIKSRAHETGQNEIGIVKVADADENLSDVA